jgi:hypothetical protein
LGVLHEHRHGTRRLELPRRHQRPLGGLADHDALDARLEVLQIRRQAQDGHDLRGDGDLEAALARHAVRRAAEAEHDVPQRAVVHVEHALPEDAARVQPQRVALRQVVVEHGRQQVVRAADGVDVAGEVQVDVLHRRQLRAPAAGGAALHAEHGSERRLAQHRHRALADPPQAVGEPDRRRGLALSRRRRRHRRDQHEPAVGLRAAPLDGLPGDLGLGATERLELLGGETDGGPDLLDGPEGDGARDLEILLSHALLDLSPGLASECQPSSRWNTRPSSSFG